MCSISTLLITTWASTGGAMGEAETYRRQLQKVKQIPRGWFTSRWIPAIRKQCSRDLRESGALKMTEKSGDRCRRILMAAQFRRSKLLRQTRTEFMRPPKMVASSGVWMAAIHGAQISPARHYLVIRSRELTPRRSSELTFCSSQLRTLATHTSFAREMVGKLGTMWTKGSFPMFRITLL